MRVNWRVVVCVGYLAPSMAPYTMMRPAKASCTAVHDLLICELTMAPKKNLTKKNTAVKSPVVKKIASKPKSSAKSSD